ncbi:hypothetical protein P4050_28050 [Pseudomonas aeruginosa]|nr:hypothetical protein [Pseudomonas aeruginosa]
MGTCAIFLLLNTLVKIDARLFDDFPRQPIPSTCCRSCRFPNGNTDIKREQESMD